MQTQKRNVSKFNSDIADNDGYRYTTRARYSSLVANRRMTDATLAAIPSGAATLVDIGCGDGTYTHILKAARPGLACTGFDPAAAAVDAARRHFPEVEYLVGDLLDPSTFPRRRFDVAVIRGVIHHLPDAAAGIANATRLSDRIILIEPNGNNPVLKWLERNFHYHIEHEEQSYRSDQLSEWCLRSGYRLSRLEYIGFVPFFFPTLPARIIHFFQPLLERIAALRKYLAAQIVIVYEKPDPGGPVRPGAGGAA